MLTIQQTWITLRISLLSLPRRLWMVASAILGISLVIFVLLGVLALENGFRQVLMTVGAEDVVIVRQEGVASEMYSAITAEQQQLIAAAPGIAVGDDGLPLVSRELYIVVDGTLKAGGKSTNLLLRGVEPAAFDMHPDIELLSGRFFQSGSNELVIGRRVAENYQGFTLGATVRIGTVDWLVVGVVESGGNAFESELWASTLVLQSLYNKYNAVQIMRMRMNESDALFYLRSYILNDPRLTLNVIPEIVYYANQSATAVALIRAIGIPLIFIMAFGAVAAAMNTMSASVTSRLREIFVLRMIGFNELPLFWAVLIESVLLCLLGALLGTVAAFAIFAGMEASTLGESFTQIIFNLHLGMGQVLAAVACALLIGVTGGLAPAIRIVKISQ